MGIRVLLSLLGYIARLEKENEELKRQLDGEWEPWDIEELEEEVDTLSCKVEGLEEELDKAFEEIFNLEEQISELQDELEEYEDEIEEKDIEIKQLKEKLVSRNLFVDIDEESIKVLSKKIKEHIERKADGGIVSLNHNTYI